MIARDQSHESANKLPERSVKAAHACVSVCVCVGGGEGEKVGKRQASGITGAAAHNRSRAAQRLMVFPAPARAKLTLRLAAAPFTTLRQLASATGI